MAGGQQRTSFTYRGDLAIAAVRAGAALGVTIAAERLRGHSVERAPVDAGDLRGSATVLPAEPNAARPTATLVFDEVYAAAQHEHSEYVHTEGAHGEPAGEDHYVSKNYEDPTRRQEYRDLIGKGVRDALDHA